MLLKFDQEHLYLEVFEILNYQEMFIKGLNIFFILDLLSFFIPLNQFDQNQSL